MHDEMMIGVADACCFCDLRIYVYRFVCVVVVLLLLHCNIVCII